MPEFQYTARDASGRQQSGTQSAGSQDELVRTLRSQGLLVLSAKVRKPKGQQGLNLNPLAYRSITATDLERGFHQVAVMLRSGMPLMDAIKLVQEFERPGARKVWRALSERIQAGDSLSEAMDDHRIFTTMTKQLVKVGEQTGRLDSALDEASRDLEQRRKLMKQFISMISYPLFSMLFAIGVAAVMLIKLIPELRKFLGMMGRALPPITQALVDVSDWLQTHILGIAVGTMIFMVTIFVMYQLPPVRLQMDRFALRIPLIGMILRLSGTILFARALGTLLRSGVRVLEALETMEKLHKNRWISHCLAQVRGMVAQGSSLSEPLMEKNIYMPLLTRMMVVGESSGTLDMILEEMAEYHEEVLQTTMKRISAIMAPLMTMVVGGMIAFIYASFLVAMLSAAGGKPGK
jgi:type IV pilus assembly protein PilC